MPHRIPAVLACFAIGLLGCGSTSPSVEESEATISEITADPPAFDGEAVTLSGTFVTDEIQVLLLDPICIGPQDPDPVDMDEYAPAPAMWGLKIGEILVAVRAIAPDGSVSGSLPDYEEGDRLTFTGTIEPTTVLKLCGTRSYRSFYFRVPVGQIDLPQK